MYAYENSSLMNVSEYCQPGDCSTLDLTTCTRLPDNVRSLLNESHVLVSEVEYDEDGCFDNDILRQTKEYEYYLQFSLAMGILTLVFGAFGLVGNTLSILVLNSKELRVNCFNNLLTALNITDSLHIVFAILDVLRYDFPGALSDMLAHPSVWPYVHYPAIRICLCASIFLIIGVGVERFLAVCRPHHYREVSGNRHRAFLYILPALFTAFAINITRFLEVEPFEICIHFQHCNCDLIIPEIYERVTALRMSKWYIIFYHFWFWILVTGIIPFIILMVLNVNIYKSMAQLKSRLSMRHPRLERKAVAEESSQLVGGKDAEDKRASWRKTRPSIRVSQQGKDHSLAVILVFTASTFFLLHAPRILTSLYEALTIQSQLECRSRNKDFLSLWFLYTIAAMNTCLVLNASSNILIYLFAGQHFRDRFRAMFVP